MLITNQNLHYIPHSVKPGMSKTEIGWCVDADVKALNSLARYATLADVHVTSLQTFGDSVCYFPLKLAYPNVTYVMYNIFCHSEVDGSPHTQPIDLPRAVRVRSFGNQVLVGKRSNNKKMNLRECVRFYVKGNTGKDQDILYCGRKDVAICVDRSHYGTLINFEGQPMQASFFRLMLPSEVRARIGVVDAEV